VIGSTIFV